MSKCKNWYQKQIFLVQQKCSSNQISNIKFVHKVFLQENFMNNESDSDVNFYQTNVSNVEANQGFDPNASSALHLNIRSMQKNFESLKEFLKNLNVSFSAICLSKTWCESQEESHNSNCILSGYNFFVSTGNIAEEEVRVLLWKNRFVAKLDQICQYILMPLSRYV